MKIGTRGAVEKVIIDSDAAIAHNPHKNKPQWCGRIYV